MKTVKNNSKKITVVVVILSFVFVNFANIRPAKAAIESSLYFDPDFRTINIAESTTLDAVVNPGEIPVRYVSLTIHYDETLLELVDATCSEDFNFQGEIEIGLNDEHNPDGTARVICSNSLDDIALTENTVVATFSFTTTADAYSQGSDHDEAELTIVAFDANSSVKSAVPSEPETPELFDGDITSGRAFVNVITPGLLGSETNPPVISNGSPSGKLAKDTTSTTISVTTDEDAVCKFSNSEGTSYANMSNTFSTTGGTSHSATRSGFANGEGYKFFVKCRDAFGNITDSDYKISFSIKDGKKKEEVKKTKRKIYNSQKKLRQGEILVQRGKRFSKNSTVMLYFSKFGGGYYAPMPVTTSGSGTFSVSYKINKPAGTYSWYALDVKTGKKSKTKTYRVR